jgi:hypothetical protein
MCGRGLGVGVAVLILLGIIHQDTVYYAFYPDYFRQQIACECGLNI